MATIRSFRGIRYDAAKAGSLESVLCPPYDVVDEAERARLTAKSPFNLIRVELPQEKPSVPATDEEYSRAADLLAEWERLGILVRDARPALYPYLQAYTGPDGKRRERRGFLTRVKVESYEGGSIRPHEKTLPKPKEDRFKLLSATNTNVSPVFGLYDDASGRAAEAIASAISAKPIVELTDAKKIEHRVWKLEDGAGIGAITQALEPSRIYIADGHHRYETAIRYRDFRRSRAGAGAPALLGSDWALAYLADVRDPGLAVFPIHRLAKVPAGMNAAALTTALERFFTIEAIPGGDSGDLPAKLEGALASPGASFALYSKTLGMACALRSKRDAIAAFLTGVAKPVASLDVSVLHKAILEEILHASYADGTVHFAHSVEDAIAVAQGKGTGHGDAGGFDLAILLHPTRVSDMVAVVDAGETMPQKSTFFYPKPASGVVMNRADE